LCTSTSSVAFGCSRSTFPCSPFAAFLFPSRRAHRGLHSSPTRRSSDLPTRIDLHARREAGVSPLNYIYLAIILFTIGSATVLLRSEEHTSELQSRFDLVCRLLLEKKKKQYHDGWNGLERHGALERACGC